MKPKSLHIPSQFEISRGKTVLQKVNVRGWTCELKLMAGRKVWYGHRRFGKKVKSLYIGPDFSKVEKKIKTKEQQLRKNLQTG